MWQRFGVALRQFDNLSARIQSRIDKLKNQGIDINAAESALNTAKTIIAQAKTDALALSDLVAQVNSASDAKALRAEVLAAVRKTNASVRAAHKALKAAGEALIILARSQRAAETAVEATTEQKDN